MKMAWRNPCRFFMQQKQSKANSEKPGKPEKVTFHTPWLQKSAYLSAGIMSHKIAYRKRKKAVFKRRLEIFIKSYFGRRL